jgi:hypothetical protein
MVRFKFEGCVKGSQRTWPVDRSYLLISSHFIYGESSDFEGMRDFDSGGNGVHGVGLRAVCREAPDPAGAEVDYDFTEDLPAVVGGAKHVDSWLDEEVGGGGLRLDGFRITERTACDGEEEKNDDREQDVGGGDGLHGWVLC